MQLEDFTEINSIKNNKFNLNFKIAKSKKKSGKLDKLYDISKYLDKNQYSFSEDMEELIPKDTPPYLDNGKNYVERIARALGFFKQCALIGPSGTGKTHIVYLVAELSGLPLWEINCGLQTSVFDLFGRYVGLGKENWIDGLIVNWCRYGGILYLDEANMMKQDVATRLNPLLDQRGHMVLTEKDNELIPRHKHAYLIISMNPFSAEFAGTKPLNAAMRRRMSVWLNFDYMSVGNKIDEKEIELICEKANIKKDSAEKIIKIGAQLREEYQQGDLPYGPSIGDLANWAKIVSDGYTVEEAAEETIISLTSDDMEIQEQVRSIVKKICGGGNYERKFV
ncbi:MAG: AAA domain-containing protein [Nitrosopumilaceae archaeon]|nr:CbbQ/NirQ/NorQ/GpvN family protein [Nitrosopumilaceae archaeon]NIU01990.1 CbbQ/NirQ/NorQ/GpvN family protein [Nitrosopumilaceae archaeon]NIU87141.1 AAA domain-containing protein [Nitrosopumilaceae archaeon]NIV64631.1 AAA domain-containing protein [Nitrosopumilaceae archaeon]NIX62591.1 AAA domain-containing protein [Nitrosopumilaceae archaeon]